MKNVLLLSFLSASFIFPVTSLANSITFTDAEDSHIEWSGGILSHTVNFGSSNLIETANNGIFDTYGLIKFENIFGLETNQLSTDLIIASAELHLWMQRETDYFPNTINLYQLTKDWDESTVTGSSYGGLLSNTTGATIDYYYKESDNNSVLPQEIVFNVTASLLGWQSGISNFGWGIESSKLNAVNYFFSSESDTGFTPYLLVNYESAGEPVPEPATMLLFGTGVIGFAGLIRRKKK